MPSYSLEELYRRYHICTQPHIFSAKLTQGFTAATSFMRVWPDTSLAQPPNLSLISAQESTHYCTELEIQGSWLSMWQLLTAEGLEAWGNWGVEALLLIPWRHRSEWHYRCSEGPERIESQLSPTVNNSPTTHSSIAFPSFHAPSPWFFTPLPWNLCSKWTITCKSLNEALISRVLWKWTWRGSENGGVEMRGFQMKK